MKEVDTNIIRDVTDDIYDAIRTCAIMTGLRPRKDCEESCSYHHICNKIFEQVAEMDEIKKEE